MLFVQALEPHGKAGEVRGHLTGRLLHLCRTQLSRVCRQQGIDEIVGLVNNNDAVFEIQVE